MTTLMTLQDIINEDWNDGDNVAYVKAPGTNYYRVTRGGGGIVGGCTPDSYFDRHDPFVNSDEEDDRRDVITRGPDTSFKIEESKEEEQEALTSTPEIPSSSTENPKRERVRLPYKPVIGPDGRVAQNEAYLWRHKPDGKYDKRPNKKTEYFNEYYNKEGCKRVKCEFCGKEITWGNMSNHKKTLRCMKNQPNNSYETCSSIFNIPHRSFYCLLS